MVDNSTPSGAIANAYAETEAAFDGKPIGNPTLASIGLKLMEADFTQRVDGGLNLPVKIIRDYHVQVFAMFGLPPDVWTAYTPLYAAGPTGQENVWASMLGGNVYSSGVTAFMAAYGGGGSDTQTATQWTTAVAAAYASVSEGQGASNAFGNYSVLENGVTVIGGTPESDFRDGTTGADVLMGFDGADHLAGGKGQDILYGGTGPDEFFGGSSDTIDGWNDDVSDLLVGGAGFDTYDVSEYADAFGEETDPSIKRDRAFYLKALDKLDVIVDSDGRGGDPGALHRGRQGSPRRRCRLSSGVFQNQGRPVSPTRATRNRRRSTASNIGPSPRAASGQPWSPSRTSTGPTRHT